MSEDMYRSYFENHCVSFDEYRDFKIPGYLIEELPCSKDSAILDIGCGPGHFLSSLKKMGYANLNGVDISDEAVEYGKKNGLNITKISSVIKYCRETRNRYDFIIMSHVAEHIDKNEIIPTLKAVRENLMKAGACFFIAVPNAQSNTGCYWAYEDFTHTTLFTAGSLLFVLKTAGFKTIKFLDPLGIYNSGFLARIFKKILFRVYKCNIEFWNRVTGSSYHKQSPSIYTFDIKCTAKND